MTGPSSLSRGVCFATALAVLAGMVLPLRLDLAATLGHSNRHSAAPVHSRLHLIKAVRMEQRVARPASACSGSPRPNGGSPHPLVPSSEIRPRHA